MFAPSKKTFMKKIITLLTVFYSVIISAQKTPITQANFQTAINNCLTTNPADGLCSDSEYGAMKDWDVSQVTDMSEAFKDKTSFNGDISSWDVSSVSNMWEMFNTAEALNHDLFSWCFKNTTSLLTDFNTVSDITNLPVLGNYPLTVNDLDTDGDGVVDKDDLDDDNDGILDTLEGAQLGVSLPTILTSSIQFDGDDDYMRMGGNANSLNLSNQRNVMQRKNWMLDPTTIGNTAVSGQPWMTTVSFQKEGGATNSTQTLWAQATNTTGNQPRVELYQENDKLHFLYGNNSSGLFWESADNFPVDTWYNITVVYDGGTTGNNSADLNAYYTRFTFYKTDIQGNVTELIGNWTHVANGNQTSHVIGDNTATQLGVRHNGVNNFKGKYTYINFFASWNNNSLHEMEVINQFQENYDFVNFISVNLDYNLKSFKKLAGSLSYDSWPIVYPLNKQGLISYFELDHLPTHLLIDPNGDIYQYPALPPTALYNNKSIDANTVVLLLARAGT